MSKDEKEKKGKDQVLVEATLPEAPDGSAGTKKEIAIDVNDITVSFRSYQERPTTLKENILNAIKHRKFKYYSTFDALSNVSFSIRKGQIVGIIGSNGAGKSTLLNVIAGVLPPVEGEVILNGSLDSLRSLGAGFDADLNAIENIYLYGSLRGRKKADIKERIPEILEFAELQDFALTPIKYYSSGMNARLGFSVAVDQDPEILLVDEVLAVGDERFQKKCRKVFKNFLSSGRTVLIVSHNMNTMEKMCDELILLSKGQLIYKGDPEEAIDLYRNKDYETRLQTQEPS